MKIIIASILSLISSISLANPINTDREETCLKLANFGYHATVSRIRGESLVSVTNDLLNAGRANQTSGSVTEQAFLLTLQMVYTEPKWKDYSPEQTRTRIMTLCLFP